MEANYKHKKTYYCVNFKALFQCMIDSLLLGPHHTWSGPAKRPWCERCGHRCDTWRASHLYVLACDSPALICLGTSYHKTRTQRCHYQSAASCAEWGQPCEWTVFHTLSMQTSSIPYAHQCERLIVSEKNVPNNHI